MLKEIFQKCPKRPYFSHWLALRGVCLIVVPMTIYMASFAAHFHIPATFWGPGDATKGSLFPSKIECKVLSRDNPLEVALGSNITLKNFGHGEGLHSHLHQYPDGSKQQQIIGLSFPKTALISGRSGQPRTMSNVPAPTQR
ncbi:Dolichyl-phosphate-mannose--protein mannosyltransferase 2 [Mucor circinelloides]